MIHMYIGNLIATDYKVHNYYINPSHLEKESLSLIKIKTTCLCSSLRLSHNIHNVHKLYHAIK